MITQERIAIMMRKVKIILEADKEKKRTEKVKLNGIFERYLRLSQYGELPKQRTLGVPRRCGRPSLLLATEFCYLKMKLSELSKIT